MTNLTVNNTQGGSDCKPSERIERIPRIIHYCWVGRNPLIPLAKKCIASWKKFCPDYKIIEWNEDNFDINYCAYTREAYDAKRWAFVADVMRLYALVNYGGIYMDTDVEVIKPLDDLLKFHAVTGLENGNPKYFIASSSMACEKSHPAFVEFLKAYDKIHFRRIDGTFNQTSINIRMTKICLKYGLVNYNSEQTLSNGLHILPQDYFSYKTYFNSNTYTLHHCVGSWGKNDERSYYEKMCKKISSALHISDSISGIIARFMTLLKFYGIFAVFCGMCRFIGRKLGIPQK